MAIPESEILSYIPTIRRFADKWTIQGEDTDDLTQGAVEQILIKSKNFEGHEYQARRWMNQAALFYFLDRVKAARHRRTEELTEDIYEAPDNPEIPVMLGEVVRKMRKTEGGNSMLSYLVDGTKPNHLGNFRIRKQLRKEMVV